MRQWFGTISDVIIAVAGVAVLATFVNRLWLDRQLAASPDQAPSARESVRIDPVSVDLTDTPIMGKHGAPKAIVEFSDFECPFCRTHALTNLDEIRKELVETEQVVYAFVHFPSPNHKIGRTASEAAECAREQGMFWQMHDRLFRRERVDLPEMPTVLAELRLKPTVFEECLASRAEVAVSQSVRKGIAAGVSATPTFLIGNIVEGGKRVSAVRKLEGAVDVEALRKALATL